ncbi:MAG: hypothetical protein Q8P60_03725 [Pseudorhodobacter sp.]|nr:hypothetical protein [Pseudorhodobacter sp.]
MITLSSLALALSGLGMLVAGWLTAIFLRDPLAALGHTTHRLPELPWVMANRYGACMALALGATLYADLKVIAYLFAVFAGMAFYDALIYGRQGHPYAKHLIAGLASTTVSVVALAAILKSGVAN